MAQGGVTRFVVGLGALVVLLATACVLFADRHWAVELFAHYRPQLALLALVLTLFALLAQRYIIGTVMLVLALLHASVLLVHWAPRDPALARVDGGVRVVSLNLGAENRRLDLVRSLIEREKPGVLALIEIDQKELDALIPSVGQYHRVEFIDDAGFGVALFSLDPIASAQMIQLAGEPFPALRARIIRGGDEITVVVAHPPPPINAAWAIAHGRQIHALRKLMADLEGKTSVLLADLNTSPWAPAFKRLIDGLSIRNAAVGFPYAPTWPSQLGVFGIPIDYVLTSNNISVLRYRTGPNVGSDHRPVIVDLKL